MISERGPGGLIVSRSPGPQPLFPNFLGLAQGASVYGRIDKFSATPGKRDALIAIPLEGIHEMFGCLSHLVARDPTDVDAVRITEARDYAARYKASRWPAAKDAIAKISPLIADSRHPRAVEPVCGHMPKH